MDAALTTQKESTGSEITGTTLPAQDLYQHDPLSVLLKDRLRLNNVLSIAGIALLAGIVLFGLSAFAGARFDLQGASLFDTLRMLIQVLILVPLLFGIYLLLPGYIAIMFNTLQANGVIGAYRPDRPGSESYEDFLKKLVLWEDSFWWSLAAVVFVALCCLFRLFVIDPQFPNLPPLWFRIVELVLYAPILYGVFLTLVRLIVVLIFMNWLFHLYTINLNPLHPDGSAGLGKLGDMLSASMLLMVTLGVDVLVINPEFLSGNLNTIARVQAVLLGAMYVALTAGLVIGWLTLPHQVMQEACDETLKPLADEFQQAIGETMPTTKDDAGTIKAGTDRLSEIKRRYQFLEDTYPTWPLAIEQVRRLVATVSLPALIPLALPLIKDLITYLSNVFGHH